MDKELKSIDIPNFHTYFDFKDVLGDLSWKFEVSSLWFRNLLAIIMLSKI